MGTLLDADRTIADRIGPDRSDVVQAVIEENTIDVHEIIAAPGEGFRLVVVGWYIIPGGATYFEWRLGATSVLKDTTATAHQPYQDRGSTASPVWRLGENEALSLQLEAAVLTTGYVTYFVEAVA